MFALSAVTVSIDYSDYLRCIIDNKNHFDEWIIVTSDEDIETQSLCRTYGLTCCISQRLYREDGTFDAVFQKAQGLNDGLSLVSTDWVVTLDSDIYLPGDFRSHLDCLDLLEGHLYGVRGRRICGSYQQFTILKKRSPWRANNTTANLDIYGYLQLFNLQSGPQRYPENLTKWENENNIPVGCDVLFSNRFCDEKKHKLELSVLHLGPVETNWLGRHSQQFYLDKDDTPIDSIDGLLSLIPTNVDLITLQFGAENNAISRLLEDRCHCVYQIPLSNQNLLDSIPDASVDAIIIDIELDYLTIIDAFPKLLRILNSSGVIYGSYFGIEHWPISTTALLLLAGAPDVALHCSSWYIRPFTNGSIRKKLQWCAGKSEAQNRDGCGVIVVVGPSHSSAELATLLASLSDNWGGAVSVLHYGVRDQAAEIVCVHFRANYVPVVEAESSDVSISRRLLYQSNIVLRGSALVTAELDSAFAELENSQWIYTESADNAKQLIGFNRDWRNAIKWLANPFADANRAEDGTLVSAVWFHYSQSVIDWNTTVGYSWGRYFDRAMSTLTPEVMIENPTTVITWVERGSVETFLQNVQNWVFYPPTKILCLLDPALIPEEKQGIHNMEHDSFTFISVETLESGLMKTIRAALREGSAIVVSGKYKPTLGANLFSHAEWDRYDVLGDLSACVSELLPTLLRISGKVKLRGEDRIGLLKEMIQSGIYLTKSILPTDIGWDLS